MVPHAHMPRSAQEEVDNLYIQRIMADDQFRRTSNCYFIGTFFYLGGDFLILRQKCSLKALVTSFWHRLCYPWSTLLLKTEALQVGRMGVVKHKDQEGWLHLFASILPGPAALWRSEQLGELHMSVFLDIILLAWALRLSVPTDCPALLLNGCIPWCWHIFSLWRFPRPLDLGHSGVVMEMTSSVEWSCTCCHGYKNLLMGVLLHCHPVDGRKGSWDHLACLDCQARS